MVNTDIKRRRNDSSRNQQGYVQGVICCVLASSVIGRIKSPDLFAMSYYDVCHSISKNLMHLKEIVLKELLFGAFGSQTN